MSWERVAQKNTVGDQRKENSKWGDSAYLCGQLHRVLPKKQNVVSGLKHLLKVKGCGLRRVLWICQSRKLVSCFSRVSKREEQNWAGKWSSRCYKQLSWEYTVWYRVWRVGSYCRAWRRACSRRWEKGLLHAYKTRGEVSTEQWKSEEIWDNLWANILDKVGTLMGAGTREREREREITWLRAALGWNP